MRALTLFCGAGGSCLGMRQAGYDVLAGLDMDADALATYGAASGHPVQHMITVDEPVPVASAEGWTGLDLLWASPPCQPWSRAGKRQGSADQRDAWPATLEAVRLLRPRWFAAENVRGVEDHLDGYVVPALRRLGYVVNWRVLNAADYGVPQTRQRVILVAGPERFRWPVATHWDASRWDVAAAGKQAWVSMGEALGLEGCNWAPDRGAGMVERHGARGGSSEAPIAGLRGHWGGGYVVAAGVTGEGRPRPLEQPAPTQGTKGTAYLLRPSPCVTATEAKGHTNPDRERGRDNPINRASDALYMATGRRNLTTDECAILQGFPTDYPWQGGVTSRYRQIGNAVPPPLAKAIAAAIRGMG